MTRRDYTEPVFFDGFARQSVTQRHYGAQPVEVVIGGDIVLSINLAELAQQLGRKALGNKGLRATAMKGAIVAKAINVTRKEAS